VRYVQVLEGRGRGRRWGSGHQEPAVQAVPDVRRVPELRRLPELLRVPDMLRVRVVLPVLLLRHLPGLLRV
jgi:hypothetical protein